MASKILGGRAMARVCAGRETMTMQMMMLGMLVTVGSSRRCFSSVSGTAAATAAAAATSSLPVDVRQAVQKEALLSNPDPAADSPSAALTGDHAPFMVATYARPPPVFVRGEGSWLWDVENRKYLDFTAGIAVTALGHCDPGVTKVLADQAATLCHASNLYHNPWTGALSQLLVTKTREAGCMRDASSVFICNSGSEANEAAIKFARKVGKALDPSGAKTDIVSFNNSFHGRTMGSLSATHNPKYQKPFAPMVPGFRQANYNDCGDAIAAAVTPQTCGVIVEPIQGEGGVQTATPEFLVALARRCREVGAVLIYDEIQCGLSRTGAFWAHRDLPPEAHPDVLTTAKALGNGFPVGAVLVSKQVADHIKVGDHGTTFGGNPLACRVAHHIVTRLAEAQLQAGVMAKSELFRTRFERLRERFPDLVGETRGRGLILGLQLTRDPTAVVQAARERGLLVITAGTNTLRFVPSLTIADEDIGLGLDMLEDAMASVQK